MKIVNILSIDGGGIRGVYAATILSEIEKELRINITSKFDLIAGTSTGSIVAGGLSIGLSPKYILDMYIQESESIFSNELLGGVLYPKYDNKTLEKALDNIFMGLTLQDTKTNLLIPATNISEGIPWTFKSDGTKKNNNIKIADAILASCSTPIYFNPYVINDQLFADGGLWANNPALAALVEAKGYNIRLFSIGSGMSKVSYPISLADKDWGAIRWGTNLIELVLNMQSLSVEQYLNTITTKKQYLRMNFELKSKLAMDDVKSIPFLIEKGKNDYKEKKDNIFNMFN